mmetsp:Transcript_45274/g.62964  ORF Transcript_45274/g.62964 Transcript_45274/m.62964 type:complete len:139 (+) Transcript_45274:140-556(+)
MVPVHTVDTRRRPITLTASGQGLLPMARSTSATRSTEGLAPMIRPLPEVTREAVARLDIRLRLVIEVMLAPRSPIAWPSVTRGHVRLPAATATQPLAGGDRLGDNEYSRHGHLRARSVRHARLERRQCACVVDGIIMT